jgi:hypothetical protein
LGYYGGYRQLYPLCRIPNLKPFENVHRSLRETGSFPQVNTELEHDGVERKIFRQQYTQNIQDDWWSKDTGMQNFSP